MSKCATCDTILTEAPGLSFCPKCMECFIPGSTTLPDISEEETFSRIRNYLSENNDAGQLMILERESGTGCTTALYALSAHQLLPASLPDFTAFYFDAHRTPDRLMRDFRAFLRNAIRSYAPRYEEPDADDAAACTRMLSDLNEQVLQRSARKKLLLFIDLPDRLPESFLLSLPRGRALPKRTGIFLVCGANVGEPLKELIPRAVLLDPIRRSSELHNRTISRLMTQTFCPDLRHRLLGGTRTAEIAVEAANSDLHRANLLISLYKNFNAFPSHQIPEGDDLWFTALEYFTHIWGEDRMRAAAALVLMLDLWGDPLPPMMLPGLCGIEADTLDDALRMPELLRLHRQEDTVVISVAAAEAVKALRLRYPDLQGELAMRIVEMAEGRIPLHLPKGGLCRFFCGAPYALSRWEDPELLDRLLDRKNAAWMHRYLSGTLGSQITESELDQVWASRVWFTRENGYLVLRIEAAQYRRELHRKQNLPAAEAADLTELLEALHALFQQRPQGRAQLSVLYEQRAECHIRACRARSALEDLDRAVQYAEPAENFVPDINRLARLLVTRGQFEMKHKLYEPAVEDYDRALRLLHSADPPDVSIRYQALLSRARVYASQQKTPEALHDLDRLCALLADDPELQNSSLRCEAYMLQGELYDREKDSFKAAAAYNRVVEYYRLLAQQDPSYTENLSDAYTARADSYERNGNWDFAYVDRCAAIDALTDEDAPKDIAPPIIAIAYLKRAMMFKRRNRLHEAISDCTNAIELLEPMISASARNIVTLCLAVYQERERMCIQLDFNARALEDRRRMAQLQILLR